MPAWGTSTLNDPKLRDKLEYCMGDGKALIILGVENEIDPMLDPVLEKQVYRSSNTVVLRADSHNIFACVVRSSRA
jgi:dynein heavy chain, axonemal